MQQAGISNLFWLKSQKAGGGGAEQGEIVVKHPNICGIREPVENWWSTPLRKKKRPCIWLCTPEHDSGTMAEVALFGILR